MGGTMEAAHGSQHGPLVLFSDQDGVRHAVRLSSVVAASDLDHARDATLLQLPGDRAVVFRLPLEQVLDWFLDAAAPPGRMTREALEAGLSLANFRFVAARLIRLLLDGGLLTVFGVEELREECLAVAASFAQGGGPLRQACGAAALQDVRDLFAAALPGEADSVAPPYDRPLALASLVRTMRDHYLAVRCSCGAARVIGLGRLARDRRPAMFLVSSLRPGAAARRRAA